MLALLREPLPPLCLALISVGIAAAVAVYCLIYTALAGRPETLAQSFGWAAIHILPWIPALEFAKRARHLGGAALAIVGGVLASLLLGLALVGGPNDVGFEAWRRLPSAALIGILALGLRWNARRPCTRITDPLPLLPRQIEWVRAAGNYVELRAGDRTVVHRSSILAAERDLAAHGFVRIHRSTLVRRDCIARVRPLDVVLHDGTNLKVGKRYRATFVG